MSDPVEEAQRRAATLSCWRGTVAPEPVAGGMSNQNFRVRDGGDTFFVRIGGDLPEHNVSRTAEIAASRAAAAAGIAPELVHGEPGAMVFRWIDGRTLAPEDLRAPEMLARVATLLCRVHRELGRHLAGRAASFWIFDVLRDYAHRLDAPRFAPTIGTLEAASQPVQLGFCHNDMLAANLVDDGTRLWLIDWEYAGYNSVLFDLAGLASNSEIGDDATETLLDLYWKRAPDAALRHRMAAMTAASLLRETLWSMIAERHSTIALDFAAYTSTNLERFERALVRFHEQQR
jgi:thiamine kinase-like enzyme